MSIAETDDRGVPVAGDDCIVEADETTDKPLDTDAIDDGVCGQVRKDVGDGVAAKNDVKDEELAASATDTGVMDWSKSITESITVLCVCICNYLKNLSTKIKKN